MPRIKYQIIVYYFYLHFVNAEKEGRYGKNDVCVCGTLAKGMPTTKGVAYPAVETHPLRYIMTVGAYLGKRASWVVCTPVRLPVRLFVGLHTLHLTITSTLLSMSSRLENHLR